MSKSIHRFSEYLWLVLALGALVLNLGMLSIVGALILSTIHQVAADLLPSRKVED